MRFENYIRTERTYDNDADWTNSISTGHNALQAPELMEILRIFKQLKLFIFDLTGDEDITV